MKRTEILDHKTPQIEPIQYRIEGHENFGFAANKRCYKLTTGFEVKQVVKGGYSRGCKFSGQFHPLAKLHPSIRPVLSQA